MAEAAAFAKLAGGARVSGAARRVSKRAVDLLFLAAKVYQAGPPAPGKKMGPNNVMAIPMQTVEAFNDKDEEDLVPRRIVAYENIVSLKDWDRVPLIEGKVYLARGVVVQVYEDPDTKETRDSFKAGSFSIVADAPSPLEIFKKLPFEARAISPKRDCLVGTDGYDIVLPSHVFAVRVDQDPSLPRTCGRPDDDFDSGVVAGMFVTPEDDDSTWFEYETENKVKYPGLTGGKNNARPVLQIVQMPPGSVDGEGCTRIGALCALYAEDVARFHMTPREWAAYGPGLVRVMRGIEAGWINRKLTAGSKMDESAEDAPDFDGVCTLHGNFYPDLPVCVERVGIEVDAASISRFLPSFPALVSDDWAASPLSADLGARCLNLANVDGDASRLVAPGSDARFFVVGNWRFSPEEITQIAAMPLEQRLEVVDNKVLTMKPLYKTPAKPMRTVYVVTPHGSPEPARMRVRASGKKFKAG